MLKLLLDEHITPDVAAGLKQRWEKLRVYTISAWQDGRFLGVDDESVLRAAALEHLTLVTYDRRTIPPLLKTWAEDERDHGGVIFVDNRTISSADVGGLIRGLFSLWRQEGNFDWTNRVYMLQR